MAKINTTWKVGPDGTKVRVHVLRYQDKAKLNAAGKPVHRQESFARKKDAEARLLQIQTEVAAGNHVARGATVTLATACDLFMKHAEDRLRDGRIGRNRYESLRVAIDRGLVPYLGAYLLTELTPALADECYRKNVRLAGVAPMTAKRRIGVLKLVSDFAARRGMMREKPADEALKELRGIADAEVRTFKPDEVTRLLKAIDTRPPRFTRRGHLFLKTFVNVAAFCGLRWGEIAALTVPSIDLDRRVLRVRHNITRWDQLKEPKTKAGIRDVPMPPHIVGLFRDWLAEFYVENSRQLLFIGTKLGRCYKAANFQTQEWYPLLKRAGLAEGDTFHFHALRHFAASWWIDNGMPLPDVAKLMGHSKVNMTLKVYAHSLSSSTAHSDMMDRMSRRLIDAPMVLELPPSTIAVAPDLRLAGN